MKKVITAIALCALFSGCASYTPRINSKEKIAPNDAVLYGRFYIDTKSVVLGMDDHMSIGFSFKCKDGNEYLVRFFNKTPVHAIKIKPSTCDFDEIVYTNVDGAIKSRKKRHDSEFKNLEFKEGTAYYLGDYAAKTEISVSGNIITTRWIMNSIAENYVSTTGEMKKDYSSISSMPTVNMMSK